MEEQFRPKETVGGSSPSRGTLLYSLKMLVKRMFGLIQRP